MQYVNDDMDEVFRRAAENYPLDTRSADWNKVLTALQGEGMPAIEEKKKNGRGKLLWLLLLLPLGLICNQLYSPGIPEQTGSNDAQTALTKNFKPVDAGTASEKPVTSSEKIAPGTTLQQKPPRDKITVSNTVPIYSANLPPAEQSARLMINSRRSKAAAGANADSRVLMNRESIGYDEREPDPFRPDYLFSKRFTKFVNERALGSVSFSPSRPITPLFNPSPQQKAKSVASRNRGFYAGPVAGLDITTVKFQKVEEKGHDYGLLLGYSLNKRWSIESGVFVASKYYYTNGKYLNAKTYLPPNTRIDEASGDCMMIEVPVGVRYDFSPRQRSGWFATVGASSFFMKEENYVYQYYYGSVGPVPHDKQYKNSSKDFFSNINISTGYRHNIANFADLRIEPYLKIPVSGMGVQQLPLFSAGIHLGITKKF